MEHEPVAILAHQRVDNLLIARGAERRHDQRLRFAAREQRRAVRARQYAGANRDRPNGARVATVDARIAGKNLLADDARFQIEQHVADVTGMVGVCVGRHARRLYFRLDLGEALGARLLRANSIRLAHIGLRDARDLRDQRLVLRGGLPVPQRLAALFHQLMNELDHCLHLLMTVDDAAEHHFFGKLVRFGLHHQNRCFGSRDDEIEL